MDVRSASDRSSRVRRRFISLALVSIAVSGLYIFGGDAVKDGGQGVKGGIDVAPPNQIQSEQPASPNASLVAAARPAVGELIARREPALASEVVASFEIVSGEPTHFLAVPSYRELQLDWPELSQAGRWLEVYLPIRPNGTTAWVELRDVELLQNPYRVRVNREDFSLQVLDDGEVILEAPVALGTGDTPTPVGIFYTEELLRVPDPDGPYGPYAFVLSGYSEHLFSFNGGPGVIGIHGTNDPDSLGSEVSHGCIRVDNAVIAELASFIPLATPIEII